MQPVVVSFRRMLPFEAALHQKRISALLEGTEELPEGIGKNLVVAFAPPGVPVAVAEIVMRSRVAHVRFGVDERYREFGIGDELIARTSLSARNAGAEKIRLEFSPENQVVAAIARHNGMCVRNLGATNVAEMPLVPGDFFSFGLEWTLSFLFPLAAGCR